MSLATRFLLAPLTVVAALLAVAPCGAAEPLASTQPANVLLITMEGTRADHLGCYDAPRVQTPALDLLKKEGAMFDLAFATAPLTLPSHASILTGLYPPRHGVRDNEGFKLDDAKTTLAEHLKGQGYVTSASVGSSLLAGAVGLSRGFDSFAAPKSGSRSGTSVVDDAIAAIDRSNGAPFFLWVQFDDTRAPYAPPPVFQARFASRPYDGAIAGMDAQIGRLLDHVRTLKMLDRTVVVATAAEGESLGEHGEDTHGLLVYDATLRVPLLMRYPPKARPANVVKSLVSLVDLAPTILDVLSLPPIPSLNGKSFARVLKSTTPVEREPVYAESLFAEKAFGWAPLHALRTGTRKYIDASTAEVYDVRRDPSETINLGATEQDAAAAFRAQLRELRKSIGDTDSGAAAGEPPRRDPKSLVAVGNLFLKAKACIHDGHPDEAVPLLEQALRRDQKNAAVASLLAAVRGQSAQAPATTAESHYTRGRGLAAKGDIASAEAELRAAVAADPKLVDGWNSLGVLLDKSKRRSDALEAFGHALAVDPDHADALFNRAKIELLASNLPDARRDVDHLRKAHPDDASGIFLEAHLCEAEKNPAGAKAALTEFLALPKTDPNMRAAAEEMLKKLGN